MLANRTLTEDQATIRRQFIDFFEAERNEDKYIRRVQQMMGENKHRLIIDMNDLLDFHVTAGGGAGGDNETSLGMSLMQQPGRYVPLLELAIRDRVADQQADYLKIDYRSVAVHAGFDGPVGKLLGPRELYARHLNTLVALEGVITRQSAPRPRVLETVHYCRETNKFTKKEYRDQLTPLLDSSHLPTVNVMPKTDMDGNALRTELGLSSFLDSQMAMLQEAPERAPTGQLPRSVEIRLDDDLVDVVKPGDRVVLVGTYMPYTTADSKSFQSIVMVNNILPLSSSLRVSRPLDSQIQDMKAFCAKCIATGGTSGVLKTLSKSVAPGVFGLTYEKQAVLLMLVGGVERKAHNSHIRGDINVLLVGEPSTAKSQLLRFVLGVAPLALNTTGKGSSGVGLTAAVTTDSYSGERSLSAGAMVLADRGVLCIDEFDKMSPQDRVSMHEAMEQQTVTIAKAGIHASLNARCSVLAAANPVYGFYSVRHKLAFNVGLPESLLSRFDLTFIVLDQHSAEHNRRIGSHILRNHMHSAPVGSESATITKTMIQAADASAASLRGEDIGDARMTTNCTGESIVGQEFLRRYVAFAKKLSPLLSESAQTLVSQHYVQLRSEQQEGGKDGFMVTARTLEAIVRLATAHAKLRFSLTVEDEDVMGAMEILRASVHAATNASAQRQQDEDEVTAEATAAAAPGVPAPAAKKARVDPAVAGTPVVPSPTTTAVTVPSGGDLTTRIRKALVSIRREQKTSVQLHELRDRLGPDVDLLSVQRAVAAMDSDDFVYDATDVEDSITFLY
ncbi:minichromosomal maintenance complex subunit, putative [Bodo saltans]|uniref:DNA replication licensing factor MCM3 n=1 Tax=Bodo saltans TaxID=75058 RepID=A0A0S4JM41_BODSA|nr:minichromosomal maintenance complex subunit, putative [Bodo saltans]|eukprot:CUG92588.1 minichromosomal maintenance complex subunit, putative [Bodo saltans]